jgi:molybdenum cofactor guanylyltransferase
VANPIQGSATLAIIAGGKAERLNGVPKGLLELEGQTVIERLLLLRPLFDSVLLVTNEPVPYARFGIPIAADRLVGRGAPAGVHAALASANTEWVVAIACDMPFVRREAVLRLLAERKPEVEAAAYEVDGRLEPLLALYRTALADRWESLLTAQPSFRELFRHFRARVLSESELRSVDPELASVRSVNTPEQAGAWGISLPLKAR